PQLGEVHDLVQGTLPQRALPKKADRNRPLCQAFRGKGRAGRNAHTAADDGIGSEIAGCRVGDMHRAAFPAAVSRFFAQQLGKHSIRGGALGEAMSVPAMRAGDVIIHAERLAYSDRDPLLPAIQVGQSRHQRAGVQFVDLFFEKTNANHLPVDAQPFLFRRCDLAARLGIGSSSRHLLAPPVVTGVLTPDMAASTSNMQAKSYLVHPMPRAAVRNSLLMAVVGSGTSNSRPRSMARTISFCIMLTSNQASSGCCRTNGPRY